MELLVDKISNLDLSSFDINKLSKYQKKKSINKQSLASYYLLDKLKIKLKDITYINGKPIYSNTFISVTHKDDYIAVAINEKKVGIDIEKIKHYNPKLIELIFTPKEKKYLIQNNNDLNFYKIFTTKEALLKINGDSLKNITNYCVVENNEIQIHNYEIQHYNFDNYILTIVKEK